MEILIGADPEFFVKKDGKHVSAYGLIDGDKKNPVKVDKGAIQVDGMALEFNIDPVNNPEDFLDNINTVMTGLRDRVDSSYEFDFSPVAQFGKEYIDAQPEKAKELGCDPDFDAYTKNPNPRPNGDLGFRTASGHIHIGWTKDMDPFDPGHFEAGVMLTKQLDCILYPISLLWDDDTTRRNMYGKPGAFRPKPYGMEYRTLSNAWLKDPELIKFVGSVVLAATHQLLNNTKLYTVISPEVMLLSDNTPRLAAIANAWNIFTQNKMPKTVLINKMMDKFYALLNSYKEKNAEKLFQKETNIKQVRQKSAEEFEMWQQGLIRAGLAENPNFRNPNQIQIDWNAINNPVMEVAPARPRARRPRG